MSDGRIDLGVVSTYRVEVLKGENWLTWKTGMDCILHLFDLFEYVRETRGLET